MSHQSIVAALFAMNVLALPAAQADTAAAAFERLRSLAGDWEGMSEWSGGRTGGGPMSATYSITGNGSAVVENLMTGGVPMMTSVYHLDGADLRMTHYCAAQNQPRLKARKIDLARGIVDFSFVDATNLRSPDAPHVYGLEIRFGDADHLTVTFLFEGGGGRSTERIELKRTQRSPSSKS